MLQQKGVEASKFHGFAYDGIWVIAKTLTRVMELLRIKQRQNTYHNFTVDDRDVGKMVLDVMNETNFNGVTVGTFILYKNSVLGLFLFFNLILHMDSLEKTLYIYVHVMYSTCSKSGMSVYIQM